LRTDWVSIFKQHSVNKIDKCEQFVIEQLVTGGRDNGAALRVN